ncbi:M48 family metalloprotease [Halomicronema sp. CCY15110]|uniref:M48 family metalloprotease n=1 Tax=Halomicronema sp. CCY15110 TaxID=2767773 RepID=UPI0019527BD7|nr:M48 family metalloprotease [Halomicronema sp. CCY15110]
MPGDSPDHILKHGLTALKTADFAAAIEQFSQLSRDRTVPAALRLKAHIGWIKALKADGQAATAIPLCQKLINHPQPQVKQWANDTLVALKSVAVTNAPTETPTAADLSGFRPLGDDERATPDRPLPPAPLPSPSPKIVDPSGFRPLDPVKEPAPTEPAPTEPATPPPATETPVVAENQEAVSATPPSEIGAIAPSPPTAAAPTASISEADTTAVADTSPSLFHYAELNQTALPEEAAPTPETTSEVSKPLPPPESATVLEFQSTDRLDRPRPLPAAPAWLWQAWISQAIGAIAMFWFCRALMQLNLTMLAILLTPFSRVFNFSLQWRYRDCTDIALVILVTLFFVSPWLLDWLLRTTAGLKILSIQKLQKTHPEGCKLLRRISQKQGWFMPLLQELPTSAPLIFSYGWLPRHTRIVVSRGLLKQLTDDEVATLIGYEMSHVMSRTLPFMSLVAVLLQLCHQGYWQVAQWGNRHRNRFFRISAAAIAAICYGVYWLFRKVNVLASRSRVLLSDRQTVVWTGNPNALMRALVKLDVGIAAAIGQTGYTPPLVESTDLLTPVGYEAAIGLGSLFPDSSFLAAIAWDIHNPYRQWLSINSSHPGLGARLRRLTSYAQRWQLLPALPLPTLPPTQKSKAPRFGTQWGAFLTQISPYLGPLLGVSAAMLLWFLGGVFEPLGLRRVGWLYGDRSVLWGSLLLGLGMGIMLRINAYFPDITAGNRLTNPSLPSLYQDPLQLPTVSQPVRLSGQLLGRPGIANWLGQDLILATPTALLKLHFFSPLGPVGNLLMHPRHPSNWVGQQVEVQGWYRRGAIAWMDVDAFFQTGKLVTKASHPLWSVALSLISCTFGLFILVRG